MVLYDHLMSVMPTPVVALNRAIAVGERDGPRQGLDAIEAVASDLSGYHLMHAARGSMLRRLDRITEARLAFEEASRLAVHERDRGFLATQIRSLDGAGD